MRSGAAASFHGSMAELDATAWNRLAGDYPFLRHEFLAALEETGCVSPATGWTPRHLAIGSSSNPEVLAPLYEKSHSWGEFVFDFAWARAWESRGLAYYPKMVLAIPFTPATGPRLMCAQGTGAAGEAQRLAGLSAIESYARSHRRSSAHALFIDEPLRAAASELGWLLRRDCHFQWHNRGYGDFDDFLASFSADKRKKARRERRRIAEAGIEFETRTGTSLDEATLRRVDALHASTFMRHGHLPYVNFKFFRRVAAALRENFVVVLARLGGELVATAVYFRSSDTLYGRYWGAAADFHSLHFETCYHQGIEFCIRNGLKRFESGTHGEHKISRGFEPTFTWSAHWLADRELKAAVARYLGRETAAVAAYADATARHAPFRA